MRFDLTLITEHCQRLGLAAMRTTRNQVRIHIRPGVVFVFHNAEQDEDCTVGFEGTPTHTHGSFEFSGPNGNCIELTYIEVLRCLSDGQVLICESLEGDTLRDRWLVHCDYNDEFKHITTGECLRVYRAQLKHHTPLDLARVQSELQDYSDRLNGGGNDPSRA